MKCFEVHRTLLPLLGEAGQAALAQVADVSLDTYAAVAASAGVTPRPHQLTGLAYLGPRRGVLVADEMRLGKANDVDSMVLTPSGWRRMGDLHVGDAVIDPDGGTGQVEAIFPQGVRPAFRVTTCDGRSTVCDDEHLWLLYTVNDRFRGTSRVIALHSFKEKLREAPRSGRKRGNRKFFLPLVAPVQFELPLRALPVTPYVLGVLLGDGHLCPGGPMVTKPDVELREAVDALLPATLETRTRKARCLTWAIVPRVRGAPNAAQQALQELGLAGARSPDKFIPVIYLRASVEDRLALLRGLMDTDGDVTRRGITSFNTTSQALCEGMRELIESLGGFTYLGERRRGRLSYQLHVRMPVNPFSLTRKASCWQRGFLARGIEAVEPVGDREMRCIQVSTKRNLFVTDGYIVTHNTAMSLLAHDPAKGPLLVVAPLSTRSVWLEWMAKLWPTIEPTVITGRKVDLDKLRKAEIIFGHHDILTHHRATGLVPGTLIVDEAHLFSNPKSKRTEAMLFYASIAWRVVLLSGTPLWNTSEGLWSLLAACNPGAWGRPHTFSQRYCNPTLTEYGWRYGGTSHEDEWFLRRNEVLLARQWKDVKADLPPIQFNLELVDLDAKVLRTVDELAYRLRLNETSSIVEDLNYYRQATGLYKVDIAADLARRTVVGNHDVVIWTWHKQPAHAVAAKLRKKGVPTFVVTGEDAITQRDAIIAAWKASPVPAALIITISVGQVGIDLSRAHYEIFVEVDWTPAVVSQALMRPFSADHPLGVTFIVLNHDVDLRLITELKTKIAMGDRMGFPAAGSAFQFPEDPEMADETLIELFRAALAPPGDMTR